MYRAISWLAVLCFSVAAQAQDPKPESPSVPEPESITSISGLVNQAAICTSSPVQLTVYSGETVLQQSSVNPGASFAFVVAPGSYTLVARNQFGCGAEQAITANQG